jgi:hypothetical protein
MARKKASGKKSSRKKKTAAKSAGSRAKKALLRKKAAAAGKNLAKRASSKKRHARASRGGRGRAEDIGDALVPRRRGLGPDSGGQSGDVQGLRGTAYGDSESVEELMEDGQSFEAEAVAGVENAPDPDQGEIRTREVPEDDVPSEYLDNQ